METTHLRHLCHVYGRKIIIGLVGLLLACYQPCSAQINYFETGGKLVYFGISLGANGSDYKIIPAPLSTRHDSIYSITSKVQPGFNLGIIGNLQVHKYFDLRFIPSLVFSSKKLTYKMTDGTTNSKEVNNIYICLPLEVRYKSKPINDFRMFVMAGLRYDYDLSANGKERKAEDAIKVKPHELSFEYGIGVQYYFPYFILSPEFKMTHGLINTSAGNPFLLQQRVIDRIFSRAFTITINLEG